MTKKPKFNRYGSHDLFDKWNMVKDVYSAVVATYHDVEAPDPHNPWPPLRVLDLDEKLYWITRHAVRWATAQMLDAVRVELGFHGKTDCSAYHSYSCGDPDTGWELPSPSSRYPIDEMVKPCREARELFWERIRQRASDIAPD